MAMSANSMKAKVEAAYLARTGQAMAEGTWDALIDLCTGIIQEIQANGVVNVGIAGEVTSGAASGATTVTTGTGGIS